MNKYAVVIELTTVEQQRIEIDANSPIDAQDQIKELMESQDRCYSYFDFGSDEKFKIKSITKLKG